MATPTTPENKMHTPHTAEEGYEKEVIEDTNIQNIDWHRHEYPLGVRTSLTEARPPYNALSGEELRALHLALTKVLPGCDGALADEYQGLRELAMWARACADWAKRHP